MNISKKITFALVAATFSFGASAQTANFEGLQVYVSGSAVSSSIKVEASGVSIEGFGASSFAADIGADYGIKLGNTSVVLLGATYGIANPTVFEISGLDPDFDGKSKMNSRWTLYAAPGVTFGDSALLYAKFGYGMGKPSFEGAKSHSGFGYGAGTRLNLSKEVFLDIEFMQYSYGKKAYDDIEVSGTSTAGTAAIGYKF